MHNNSHSLSERVKASLTCGLGSEIKASQLDLLQWEDSHQEQSELSSAPIFNISVLNTIEKSQLNDTQSLLSQYGLLAGLVKPLPAPGGYGAIAQLVDYDPRIFFNITAPSSTFICGSQGSGKSHTLSCLLENCLSSSVANKLPNPLTGLVFHYDTFISDEGGSPCEAAFLSSDPQIQVRVLCSPSNLRTIQIEPLRIEQSDLNTKRMIDLMALRSDDGSVPLYMQTVYRILREMRIAQQQSGGSFSYNDFKRQMSDTNMVATQLGPLNQRLDTLESFMPPAQTSMASMKDKKGKKRGSTANGTSWIPQPGCLTIVDLSCPCVTSEMACSLFNMCLSLFLEQDMTIGKVVALDEAHKYMNTSAEALTLTNTLLSAVRLQRHLGVRTIISTQEPTISSALLDLCSITITHRFTSPEWLRSLRSHLAAVSGRSHSEAGLSSESTLIGKATNLRGKGDNAEDIFAEAVKLRVGEAILFAPNAVVTSEEERPECGLRRLGAGFLKIRVRKRLTMDGGQSVMAS